MSLPHSDRRHSLTIALQIDEVCDRFESAWEAGNRPRIEDFLVDWRDEQRATLLQELLAVEIKRRSEAGEAPSAEEYQALFPDEAEFLADFFATVSGSTDRLPSDETMGDGPPSELEKYRIIKPLGGGGFGNVYLAKDTELGRKVALKVPRPERIRTPLDAERFLAEAQILAKLKHPNIVTVYDAGRSSEGIFYVVSELIEGSDLAKLIRRQRLAHGDSAELIAQIADALQHAHGQKLIHRDVKPANILIDSKGKPYLTDFGLALSDEDFGKEASMAGTPHYMSPEQARGEGHLVDGRSDMFSLGVVFYELLTGDRPFRGAWEDVLDQIRTLEPRPPRQLDPTIPKELERICLKAISKRASDRYTATLDMADDLHHFLESTRNEREGGLLREPAQRPGNRPGTLGVRPPETLAARVPGLPRIVPKGLRSFDELDADFFLELLPGPRDREGLPEVIRFWKRRIEARDADHSFRVGLIYGPSGSGKSSLVKAGLIPRMADEVVPVYVELAGLDDERILLVNLRKKIPSLPAEKPLVETLADLRRGRGVPQGKKVLILLDQFEQWLHRNIEPRNTDLVAALRQCDGQHVQCILLARDDFWMATTRFMHEVDVPIIERGNSAAVDLFDPMHGRKVLAEFGRAFGRLPENLGQLSKEQEQFLDLAIAELTQGGKIVPVRLALFADIVRGKPWTPATLKKLGGTQGVTITFLEETFGADTAPPEHRLHQKAAREVLQTLLPEGAANIKGHRRSHGELLEVSGYRERPQLFAALMRILDVETRLLTPIEPRATETTEQKPPKRPVEMYYHLTHDHLIQPLREWLTIKERATRRGRAQLLLAERANQWTVKPESRQLPSWWEYLKLRLLTRKSKWSPAEARMMRAGRNHHSLRAVVYSFVVLPLVLLGITSYASWKSRVDSAERLFIQLTGATTAHLPGVIDNQLDQLRRWILPKLRASKGGFPDGSAPRINMSIALIKLGEESDDDVDAVRDFLLNAESDAFQAVREYLPHAEDTERELWRVLLSESDSLDRRFRAACALATCQECSAVGKDPRWSVVADSLVQYLIEDFNRGSKTAQIWQAALKPAKGHLLGPIGTIFRDTERERQDRNWAIHVLMDYAADDPETLAELLLDANESQFSVLFGALEKHAQATVPYFQKVLGRMPPTDHKAKDTWAKQQVNAAIALLRWGRGDPAWQLLRRSSEPSRRSYLVHRMGPLRVDINFVLKRLDEEADLSTQRALILSLGGFPEPALTESDRTALISKLQQWYRDPTDAGLHAATEWLLRLWGEDDKIAEVISALSEDETDNEDASRKWYVNSQGQTMIVLRDPPEFLMGSPPNPEDDEDWELQHRAIIGHSFVMSAHEVTLRQWDDFARMYYPRHAGKYTEGRPNCPVNMVSWYVAAHYCNWLNEKEGIPEDQWCYIPSREPPPAFRWTLDEFENVIRMGYGRAMPTQWANAFNEYVNDLIQSKYDGRLVDLIYEKEDLLSEHWKELFERLDAEPAGLYQHGMTLAPNYLGRVGYRLPNEMEWEFACRAGTVTVRNYGDSDELLDRYAWYDKQRVDGAILEVGNVKPNDFGLFDMHGNLAEWCNERLYHYPDNADEARMDKEEAAPVHEHFDRMIRGGKFTDPAAFVRTADRTWYFPGTAFDTVGIRLVRTLLDGPTSQKRDRN